MFLSEITSATTPTDQPEKIAELIETCAATIRAGTLTPARLSDLMSSAFDGSDASGAWAWRQAYDVMEAAGLRVACEGVRALGFEARAAGITREVAFAQISALQAGLITQTRRSEAQMMLQQFSTPLDLAYLVARASAPRAGEVVLEPSCGNGLLAGMVQALCAGEVTLVANERDPFRAALAKIGLGAQVTSYDAEFIDDHLAPEINPSLVVMNPPFSSCEARSADSTIALRHAVSAAKRLASGGRFVAILPMGATNIRQSAWRMKLLKLIEVEMCIGLPDAVFAKMGTTVSTLMVVGRRLPAGHSSESPLHPRFVPDLAAALRAIKALPARQDTTGNGSHPITVAAAPAPSATEVLGSDPQPQPVQQAPSRPRIALRPRAAPQAAASVTSVMGVASGAPQPDVTASPTAQMPRLSLRTTLGRRDARSDVGGEIGAIGIAGDTGKSAKSIIPLAVTIFKTPRLNPALSDVYARYAPQRLSVAGAQAHPSTLVESLAMGSVAPPTPDLGPDEDAPLSLPQGIIDTGQLSEAQLETVIMAETSFRKDLPGCFTRDLEHPLGWVRNDSAEDAVAIRQGYFLGDGTGCGKGRQVAGIILAGWSAGRRRAVWVSRSATLIEDAIRDWTDLGGARTDIHAVSKWKADEEITLKEGILFVTYATLRAQSQKGRTRLEQLLDWLGAEFEGVMAFDEAHAMQNAGGGESDKASGGRKTAPSQQGLAGLRLQQGCPRARVLYVSATGATEVANLAYASRLGLWGAGAGYAFPSREAFVTAMEAGGVAAMEVVARDLKALGLYTARALSFEGVEYDILTHDLSEAQIAAYDDWARAFQLIHQNLHKALEATGVTAEAGNEGQSGTGMAKSAALSAFESTKQRFFGHLLQGMKMPTILAAMEADLAAGFAPVVQIVSTGEALLKRRIESLGPDEELIEASLTPREYVLGYLQSAFPIHQRQLVEQEDGSVVSEVIRDETGAALVSREAVALRDEMIEQLMLLAPIPSALDQLIWHFGPERVAEVTGRSQRPLRKAGGALKIERRSASANSAETAAFMDGEKDILVFSDAGGTGRSYQASPRAQNQKRRRHYLLEPGWRADVAIQGLGRTHRAAQVSAPFFRVCTSSVHGEKRFTSTIARRLDTLGALTKGQRETAGQGMFRAEDNLESPIARAALRRLYIDIVNGGEDAPIPLEAFCHWTGLKLTDKEGVMLEDLPPIQRFLNRLLALPIAMQNVIFENLMGRIQAATERAMDAGTLGLGLERLKGDRINAKVPEVLRICPMTGAETALVPLTIEEDQTYFTAAEALSHYEGFTPMQNAQSGKVALIAPAPRRVVDEMGNIHSERRIIRPSGATWQDEGKFLNSHWEKVELSQFKALWDGEVAGLPAMTTREVYLLTGLLLPIWGDIPSAETRIYRAICEDGATYLGRALSEMEAGVMRGRFIAVDTQDAASILRAVVEGRQAVELPRGITLQRRRVAGRDRVEITGYAASEASRLKSLGCYTEIHQFALRMFLPFDADAQIHLDTQSVIEAILGNAATNAAA